MAQKHMVICQSCGKRFDVDAKGGYYNAASRRYTCKSCAKKAQANRRERTTGMRQSTGAMIAKIAAGALFVFVGIFQNGEKWQFSMFATGLVLGAALIAWGLLPYLKVKKAQREAAEAEAAAAEAERLALENEPWICPACKATTKGAVCEYCGSPRQK